MIRNVLLFTMLVLGARQALCEFKDVARVDKLRVQDVKPSCSYRLKLQGPLSRQTFFNITSESFKPVGFEAATMTAQPFADLRSVLTWDQMLLMPLYVKPGTSGLERHDFFNSELRLVVWGAAPKHQPENALTAPPIQFFAYYYSLDGIQENLGSMEQFWPMQGTLFLDPSKFVLQRNC